MYAVYRTRDEAAFGKTPLEFLRVSQVDGTTSILVPTSARTSPVLSIDESAYALQYAAGVDQSLCLYASAEDHAFLLQAMARHIQTLEGATHPVGLQFVDIGEADLAVAINNAKMHIEVLYPPIKAHGLHAIPFSTDIAPGDVYNTLSAALHFFWHLKRKNAQQSLSLQGQVKIEFHRLQEVPADDDFDDPSYEPFESDLNISGTISLLIDNDAAYGITLINNSSFPLYPSLFYFSGSDLSVSECLSLSEH